MNHITYLCDPETSFEAILCRNSAQAYPCHNHVSVYTIGLVLEGALRLTQDHFSRVFEQDEVFILAPYVPHSLEPHPRYSLLTLCIPKAALLEDPLLFHHAERLLFAAISPFPFSFIPLLEALRRLKLCPFPPSPIDPFIESLRSMIERTPEVSLPLSKMSKYAFISKYHLLRIFKHSVGLTPHQFQMQNRIRKAQRLLRHSSSITEAALTAGFFDQSHFIRYFEKIVQLTPSAYLSSLRFFS